MSLILDALKKAENERNGSEPVPNIATDHSSFSEESSSAPWLWFVVAFVIILATLIGLAVLFKHSDTPSSNQSVSAQSQNKVSQHPPADTRPQNITQAKIDKAMERSKQKSLAAKQELIKSQYKDHEATQKESAEPDATAADKSEDIQQLYANKPSDTTTATSEINTKRLESPTKQSKAAKVETRPITVNTESLSAYTNVKLIKELPFSAQENVPTLMYTEHHYNGKTGSTVVINGQQLRENANIEKGVRIEQILEDGILLKQNSHQFKMQALNSWLNF